MAVRVTQVAEETLYTLTSPEVRATQAATEVLFLDPTPNTRISQSVVEVLISNITATALELTGPTTGSIDVPSSNFTVSLNSGSSSVSSTVTVTPSDSGDGGTFTPTSLQLTSDQRDGTFTYTPASYGTKTISISNNGSLTNPSSIAYVVTGGTSLNYSPTTLVGSSDKKALTIFEPIRPKSFDIPFDPDTKGYKNTRVNNDKHKPYR